MAQRPSFDMTKLSTADKILLGGSLLLFIDSFLRWQQVCGPSVLGLGKFCVGASAWNGNAGFAGVIMSLLALVLFLALGATILGVSMPSTIPVPTALAALTGGTVLFGLIKFIFAVTNHGAYGAWVGIILLIAIAYGGYMKMQEAKAIPGPGPIG
jgi:hypothetical protein